MSTAPSPHGRRSSRLDQGTRLGPYRVVASLGQGAMGRVLHVRDETGRDLALKLLTQDVVSQPQALARFQREGQITASLRHPGIVAVHDAGELEGWAFITYDFIPGGRTLDDAFAELPLPQRLQLVLQAAEALALAHAAGVVHRDLKPANVLVDERGQARVADFGLAQAVGLERLTRTGAMVGTPTAMAPEQITGQREAFGPPTDVWALGVMLYQALTRELPFEGGTLAELAAQIARATPPRPSKLDPRVDRALDAVCLRALAKEPEGRYPEAGAFAEDLRRALDPSEGPPAALTAGARPLWPVAALLVAVGVGGLAAALRAPAGASVEPAPSPTASASEPGPASPQLALEAALSLPTGEREAALRMLDAAAVRADPRAQTRLLQAQAQAAEALRAYQTGPAPTLAGTIERLEPLATLANLGAADAAPFPGANEAADRALRLMLGTREEGGERMLELLVATGARVTDQGAAMELLELWELAMPQLLRAGVSTQHDIDHHLRLAAQLDMAFKRGTRIGRERSLRLLGPRGDDALDRYLRARFDAEAPSQRALLLRWQADPPPELALGPIHRAELTTIAALEEQDLTRRLALLEAALAEDPESIAAWFPCARTLSELGRDPEAVEAIQTALRLYDAAGCAERATTFTQHPANLSQAVYVFAHAGLRERALHYYAQRLSADGGKTDSELERAFPWLRAGR